MLRKKIIIGNMITWCLLLLATIILNIFMTTSNYEVNRINTKQKIVMLTFDDGPTVADEKILDILKQENIKATFFQTGKNIARYDSEPTIKHVLDRIINEGHAIGNHSYFHQKYMTKQKTLINELQATNNLIKKVYKANNISISDINIPIRMPYLQYYRGLDYVQKKLNIPYWIRGYLGTDYDEEKAGKDLILKQYKSHLKPGIIFVAHTRAYAQSWLKDLIVWLKQQGYQFASFNQNNASYYGNYGNLVN
ncbi:polysaccharide deacetylase family protein [Spiroplasma melliferum]|uniref:Chitin deacetylase n=3 Tax=Spiroplasma melliferum TaxID=2134 RepID=A0AAI9T448_SPIME|nr:polysaccharide deacetylase family protein [Spiroplasma melliferum]ELL44680.1 putative chitin deacetylase [Spiroplasma melliferum IPMB4A]KAI92851.1 chitin deacetylase [Spiroplasma melliferum KC3]QCO24489.1 putative chitin deacetylase [Spiroplasma melliferum]